MKKNRPLKKTFAGIEFVLDVPETEPEVCGECCGEKIGLTFCVHTEWLCIDSKLRWREDNKEKK